MDTEHYIPGVCNIGKVEIGRRMTIGWISLILSLVLLVAFGYLHINRMWYLFLFFPVTLSVIQFLQAFLHFCASFGMKGVFNFSSELAQTESVSQQEFRKLDQSKAWSIIWYSVIAGLTVALSAYYIS